MKKQLFVLAALTTIFSGCVHDDFLDTAGKTDLIPIGIHGSINQQQTRATAEGFVGGDAVGLYAVNYNEDNTVAGTLVADGNQADNVKYVFDEGAHKWTPVRSVYYKDINTHADLYLYYPYQASISNVNDANFEVRKDQSAAKTATSLSGYEASDFLWGKATDITPSQSAVNIQLSHRLSAVQVTLAQGTGFSAGEFGKLDKNIILTNTTRKASIDYATGTATPIGDPQADGIVMCPQGDGSFRAVVIPQSIEAGNKLLAITIDGIAYSFKQNEMVKYMTGRQLNFTITINKKSATGQYELVLTDTQIVEWTEDLNTHGGEARQYFVVNVTEPGTLGATIKAMGKNPDKIRNLKVVGNVRDDDFYFMRDSMAILEAVNMKESVIKDGNLPDYAFDHKSSLCYFVFPEQIKNIGNSAFDHTSLSGPLFFSDGLISIGFDAFNNTLITSLSLPESLSGIGERAFCECSSLMGDLLLPPKISEIGNETFLHCNFNGRLELPTSLKTIGRNAFEECGHFRGDLVIPLGVESIPLKCFSSSRFSGSLVLNNVKNIDEDYAFSNCGFSGELVIPEGLISIKGHYVFYECNFTSVVFPSTIKFIGYSAFFRNERICNNIILPEGLIAIDADAFNMCGSIIGIELPSSLQRIGARAFEGCYGISRIICHGIEPAEVDIEAFNGVPKDNFTVEVPNQSVKRYQAEPGWGDFKRIAAHYDFSLSSQIVRVQNHAMARTYTLRAPANFSWSIESKPDWVSVSPESGIGRTDVIIAINEMHHTSEQFEVNEGTFNLANYVNYKGRNGEIVFKLNDKGYYCSMDVEQYDNDYADGDVLVHQTATKGNGIDIIFIGDGYDAKDIAKGTFADNVIEAYNALFDIEPYRSYKDYFNVYSIVSMSDESGVGTVNTKKSTKFGSYCTPDRILLTNADDCFFWASKAKNEIDFTKSLVIMLLNTPVYEGVCLMYGDGSAIACCPVSREAYPYDFRGIIQHEAGGHGFGKLADEYIYHNAFIQNCECTCCEHPRDESDKNSTFGLYKSKGWYKNLSISSDPNHAPWSHLIYHPQYSNYVDMFEGGYMHSRGVYRSEATSCMNNNIPYYSAISRQAIVERILEISGEGFTLEKFYANDSDAFGSQTKAAVVLPFDRTFGVDPKWNRGSENGSVIYMGEHPNYSKIK